MGGWDADGGWLSVEVAEDTNFALVALYSYKTRGGMELAPFSIWLGDEHGHVGDGATNCTGVIEESPSTYGAPMIVPCEGRGRRFLTVKQQGRWRSFSLSELAVYAHANYPQPPPARNTDVTELVRSIQARFDHGVPSNRAVEAGVIMHMFDEFEFAERPWELCRDTTERLCPTPVDHVSCSIINADRPFPWGHGIADYVGVILAADTPILCGYSGDMGTGGAINGGCGFCPVDGCRDGGRGYDVEEAIRRSDGQNEVIVGQLVWAQRQPDIFAAVVYLGEEGEARARDVHTRFLQHFGLPSNELPLVRYEVSAGRFHAVAV